MSPSEIVRVLSLVVAGCLAACGGTAQTPPSCTTDAQCSDGVFCNGVETCDPYIGECADGAPVVCADDVACTVDRCDEEAGACVATDDDTRCGEGERCSATGCSEQAACRMLDWRYGATIELVAATAVADATVALTLDTAALIAAQKLQPDCDDLRIARADGTAIPHWVDGCNTAASVVWLRVTDLAAGTTSLDLNYGNPGAVRARSLAQTFVAAWDFEGNDLEGWTPGTLAYQPGIDGPPAVSTTTATAAGGAYALFLRADAGCRSEPYDGASSFVARAVTPAAGAYCVDFDWRADVTGFEFDTDAAMLARVVTSGATGFEDRTGCSGDACTATGAWMHASTTMPAAGGTLRLEGYATDCADGDVYFDNVRVRTCVSSADLTAAVGIERDCSTL